MRDKDHVSAAQQYAITQNLSSELSVNFVDRIAYARMDAGVHMEIQNR